MRQKSRKIRNSLTIGFLASAAISCGHGNQQIPEIQIKTWAGDYKSGSIVRPSDNEAISCRDSLFDRYLCLSYDDMQKIMSLLVQCEDWGRHNSGNMMRLEELTYRNKDVMKQYERKVGQ
jgi:hypothetical protein